MVAKDNGGTTFTLGAAFVRTTMNIRRPIRLFVLCLTAAALGACHFHHGHGHCGSWGWGGHHHHHVRHCR